MIRMVLTSALMLLVLTSTASSQVVFDLTGTGARALGMGNAFIAVSNDASAASWNPAGLTAQDKLLMGFDIDHFAPENDFTLGSDQFLAAQNFNDVSQFSIVAPFRFRGRAMVLGLSYGRSLQEYWNQGSRDSSEYINFANNGFRDTSYVLVDANSTEHSNLSVLNMAVATKLTSKVSGGIGINIYSGSRVNVGIREQIIPEFTKDVIFPQYVYQVSTLETIDTAKYSGSNFTFGLKYDGDKADVGLMVRSAFDLNLESDIKLNYRTVENDLLQRLGSDTIYVDNRLVKVGMPWVFGLGAAAHPNENVTFSADFEYRGFSGQEVKVRDSIHIRPGSDNEEFYTLYDLDFNNSTAFRLGAEYLWHTPWTSFPIIPLRAGFSTVSLPLNLLTPDLDPNDGIPSPSIQKSSIKTIHVGTGVKWSQIYLDVAMTWSSADVPFEDVNASWDYSSSNLVFGFTGYF